MRPKRNTIKHILKSVRVCSGRSIASWPARDRGGRLLLVSGPAACCAYTSGARARFRSSRALFVSVEFFQNSSSLFGGAAER